MPLSIHPTVVIPVYKLDLNRYERISLQRHLTVLRKFDRYLLLPTSLKEAVRSDLLENFENASNVHFHPVEDAWLSSHRSYNQLMLTLGFYQYYKKYSHILIAQLDAYTFDDQLEEWCKQPFAYIGAPIYKLGSYWEDGFLCMGAGGYSLRHTDSFIRALTRNPVIHRWADLAEQLEPFNAKGKLVKIARYLPCWLQGFNRLREDTNQLARCAGVNEDVCYAKLLPAVYSEFKVAGYKDSVHFCIDSHVKRQLEFLNGRLPFAAHGWWTWPENLKALSPHIDEL
jgi:hypothetical protein